MAFVIKDGKLYYMSGRQWGFNKARATQYVERELAEKAIRKMAPEGNYEIVPAETVTNKRPLFKSGSSDVMSGMPYVLKVKGFNCKCLTAMGKTCTRHNCPRVYK